jgi:endonuclease/exonuclease/phosphatase family metal-dependent hydrolase
VSVSERTWPSLGPLALIPLDHVLLSPQLAPAAFRSFRIPGSDHRGIMATIALHRHAT